MSEMFPPTGPPSPDMAQHPGSVNGQPQPGSGLPVGPADGALLGDVVPDLQELVQAIALAAKAQAVKAQNAEDGTAASKSVLALAQAMAELAPPMKPIDPQLHASTRGVDPQRALEMRHEAEMDRLRREHERQMAAIQAERTQQGGEPSDNGGQTGGQ